MKVCLIIICIVGSDDTIQIVSNGYLRKIKQRNMFIIMKLNLKLPYLIRNKN